MLTIAAFLAMVWFVAVMGIIGSFSPGASVHLILLAAVAVLAVRIVRGEREEEEEGSLA